MVAPENLVRPPVTARHSWRALCAAAFMLAVLGGCGLSPHFEHPRLSVVRVEVEGAQILSQRFRIRIRVENPNDRALPIRALSFTMQLAGEDFGHGESAAAFTVPARGEGEFETIVTTDLATTLMKIMPRLKDRSQPIEYRLTGKVETDLAFLSTVPFDQRGSFTLN